jgi:predicted RNA-binding protein YlqC (UPF0109 family)
MTELVRFLFEKTGHQVPEGALVSSTEAEGEKITLTLNSADINKFAGSEARLVRSFRALLSVAAAARNTRVTLEINEAA